MFRFFVSFLLLSAVLPAFGSSILQLKAEKFKAEKGKVEAFDNFTLRYESYLLKGKKLIYDLKTETAYVLGNLTVTDGRELFLKAERGIYHLKSGEVELFNAEGRLKKGYFRSQYVRFKGGRFVFKNFCASKCADFQAEVCAKRFVYEKKEGKGTAYSALVKVEKLPVLYSPYYAFMTKRKTGFLAPTVGFDVYDNFIYRQPFFWAIDPHSDLTLYGDYRSGGLYGAGFEFRKYFSYDFYLRTENYYYYDDAYPKKWWEGRNYSRKNRFLLSAYGYKGRLSFGWDYPSDKDLYYDVFFNRKELHYKSFARSYLDYLYSDKLLNLDFRVSYFYNLLSEDRSRDLALLPDLFFYLRPYPLGKGFTFDAVLEATNFYAERKSFWRFRIEPSIRWSRLLGTSPLSLELKPFYTYYTSRRYENYHHVAGLQFKASLLLYNFDLFKGKNFSWFSAWETEYKLQPFKPKGTPSFDYFDTLSRQNLLLLRGLNRLYWEGFQFGEVIVEQPYNFYGGYNLPTDGHYIASKIPPLKIYYSLTHPSFPLWLDGKLYYDYDLKDIFYQSATFRWKPFSSLSLKGGYVLSKNHLKRVQTEQYTFGWELKLGRLSLSGEGYYDKLIEKTVDLEARVGYRKECWSLGLTYGREFNRDSGRYEWQVFLTFTVFARPLNLILAGGKE